MRQGFQIPLYSGKTQVVLGHAPGFCSARKNACPMGGEVYCMGAGRTFWVGLSINLKKIFFVSEISADPPKSPYGAKEP